MKTYHNGLPPDICFERWNAPHIQGNHVDGPMLCFSDGQLHWLTLWERLLYAIGFVNAETLQRKRRPEFYGRTLSTQPPRPRSPE